jgi:hypothetical protein
VQLLVVAEGPEVLGVLARRGLTDDRCGDGGPPGAEAPGCSAQAGAMTRPPGLFSRRGTASADAPVACISRTRPPVAGGGTLDAPCRSSRSPRTVRDARCQTGSAL